jgi:16S rRNA (guanine966-N2)-methyltransferase
LIAMRIIAGEFRGRRLLGPEGDRVTRPITDRVKQSLFDILAPRIEGTVVYDCFAGTGSMGLECLSRGAAAATFFEADRSALARLRRNIEAVRVVGRAKVVGGDVFRWFASSPPPVPEQRAGLVFLDPPYRFLVERPEPLRELAGHVAADHLASEGVVILRRDTKDRIELPPLAPVDMREYGGMVIEFLAVPPAPGDP